MSHHPNCAWKRNPYDTCNCAQIERAIEIEALDRNTAALKDDSSLRAEVDRLRLALAASRDEAEKAKDMLSFWKAEKENLDDKLATFATYAAECESLRASTKWREGLPDVPEGKQRRYLVSANSGKWVGILLYSNKYWAPCSDDAEPPEGAEVNDDGDVCWSGWCEESCQQCDTFWTFAGKVDGWKPLPAALRPAHTQTKST